MLVDELLTVNVNSKNKHKNKRRTKRRPSSKSNLSTNSQTLSIPMVIHYHLQIRELRLAILAKQQEVEEKRTCARKIMQLREKDASFEPKLIQFRKLVRSEQKLVTAEQRAIEKRRKHLIESSMLIKYSNEQNQIFDHQRITQASESYNHDRVKLQFIDSRLKLRRHKMCRQLLHIFPFRKVHGKINANPNANRGVLSVTAYQIRNMSLPSRADKLLEVAKMGGEKEEQMAVGLGYIAHLCILLSSYMQIPLRHGLICRGSRSKIVDAFIEAEIHAARRENKKCKHKTAEYPLYSKNEDDRRFSHAVRLLQENICQLCTHIKIEEPAAFIHNIRTVLYDMALARF